MNSEALTNTFAKVKDSTSSALNSAFDFIKSTGSSVGSSAGTTVSTGVDTFKGTSLGETFFKNITKIIIAVFILIGGIIYVDFAKNEMDSPAPKTIQKTLSIEPNETLLGHDGFASLSDTGTGTGTGTGPTIPTDEPWSVPILSMKRELTEGFGAEYTQRELEKIHTGCRSDFCVIHNKSPEELEKSCNSISNEKVCSTKCCCGWTKFIGHEGDTDPVTVANSEKAKKDGKEQKTGKCVSGNSKTPLNYKDVTNQERDIEYYYYMGKCVKGNNCQAKDQIRA